MKTGKRIIAVLLAFILVFLTGCSCQVFGPTEAPTEPSAAEPSTAELTEAPTESPSTAAPSTASPSTEEPSTQEPTTAEPTTEPEPIVYDPVSEENVLGEIVPASLHRGAEQATAVSVSFDSTIGTVNALRDGNFYYLFLPAGTPDTLAFSLTGQAIASVNPGKFSGQLVQVEYEGVTSVEVRLQNGHSVYVILMRSSVPGIHVVLNQVSLATVHADKRIKYQGNSVYLYDPENPGQNIAVGNVEFKGRGNSSWNRFTKKGYQIKFEKRMSVLGMESAKKWCLVPSAGDGSLLRNKIALEIARSSGCFAFTSGAEFVDLWISGEYRGLYLITEKVEIDKNRLALEDPTGVLVELDEMFYAEDPYMTSPVTGHHYVEKDTEEELTHNGLHRFMECMADLERKLISHAAWSSIESAIDVQSFAAFYIMQEFTHNAEDLYTSCFFYQDGPEDEIHMGPVWDYDSCLGFYGDGFVVNYIMDFIATEKRHTNILYLLGQYPEFQEITRDLFEICFRDQIGAILEDTDRMYHEIKASADMNFIKYPGTLGRESWKGNMVLPTFEANVINVQNWMRGRNEVFVPYRFFTTVGYQVVKLEASVNEPEPAGPDESSDPAVTDPAPTDPPATDPPVTDPPATDPPATDLPATDPPVTDSPATDPAPTDPAPTEVPPESSSEVPPETVPEPSAEVPSGSSAEESSSEEPSETETEAPPRTYAIPATFVTQDPEHLLAALDLAVWTEEGGQGSMRWYAARRAGDNWVTDMDLADHPGVQVKVHLYGTFKNRTREFIVEMQFKRPVVSE